MFSQEQIDQFNREGCLCIPNFLTEEETSRLLQRSKDLLTDFDPSKHPKTQFVTGDEHVGDEYFFDSSDKISYFFDADAFNEKGQLNFPKERAINKIGHGLHMHDQVFKEITLSNKVQDIARKLDYKDPRVLQSMCIFKQPIGDNNGERDNKVPIHTDGTFLFTKPQTAIGFWFALEDCNEENGCLWYHPGSHKKFPITKRFVKKNGGDEGTTFIDVETDGEVPQDSEDNYKIVECKAGSLVLIHNSVLHKSENNRSNRSRFIYAFHVIDGTAEYDHLNWLQVPPSKQGGTEFTRLYS